MLVTSLGTVIRTETDNIRVCGRISQGVRVMRTGEGEQVIGLATVSREESEADGDETGSGEDAAPAAEENQAEEP